MSESMGTIIRRLRRERNLTQEELAELLGVTFQAVSKWENDTGMPDISQVVPLARVFGVSTDTIFGTEPENTGDDDIDEFIRGIEHKICNCPDGEDLQCRIECVNDVRLKLKEYPSNFKLLAYSLGHLYGTISDLAAAGKTEESKSYIPEFIRNANLVLNHCTEVEYLNEANMWYTYFYLHMGDTESAEKHASRLPKTFSNYGYSMLAYVKAQQGNREESMKLTAQIVSRAMKDLMYELHYLGNHFDDLGKTEEAYECYALFPDIYDLIMKDREPDIPFYDLQSYDQLAVMCMKLGRHEEAMDQLERYFRYEQTRSETYNIITESKIPYFYGRTLRYSHDHYTARNDMSELLSYGIFDPIRDTERFKALAERIREFEKKYN